MPLIVFVVCPKKVAHEADCSNFLYPICNTYMWNTSFVNSSEVVLAGFCRSREIDTSLSEYGFN